MGLPPAGPMVVGQFTKSGKRLSVGLPLPSSVTSCGERNTESSRYPPPGFPYGSEVQMSVCCLMGVVSSGSAGERRAVGGPRARLGDKRREGRGGDHGRWALRVVVREGAEGRPLLDCTGLALYRDVALDGRCRRRGGAASRERLVDRDGDRDREEDDEDRQRERRGNRDVVLARRQRLVGEREVQLDRDRDNPQAVHRSDELDEAGQLYSGRSVVLVVDAGSQGDRAARHVEVEAEAPGELDRRGDLLDGVQAEHEGDV